MISQKSGRVLGDWFQNACELGETNLRIQQEMLFGWTRLFPILSRSISGI